MSVLTRHHAERRGTGDPALVFAHGFGCDQSVWQQLAPDLSQDHAVLLYDQIGAGHADRLAYRRSRYATLDGHAQDLIELCDAAGLDKPVLIAHSFSTMVGVVAAGLRPELFRAMVLIAPSPRYIDDGDYIGGFSAEDIEGLIETLDRNYFQWARMMAPVIMGNADQPQLTEDLTHRLCTTDPFIAAQLARVIFTGDHRDALDAVQVPCAILQCTDDALAPPAVGRYLQQRLPQGELIMLNATGHCPHLSAPAETLSAIRGFLARLR